MKEIYPTTAAPKVIAVVVTHNPDNALLEAQTLSLRPQVNGIICVDNASASFPSVESEAASDVQFVKLEQNVGLARAQNIGVTRALEQDADFVLLMDHDSIPAPEMVAKLLGALQSHPGAAAAGPFYTDPRGQARSPFIRIQGSCTQRLQPPTATTGLTVEVDHLIASGCLVRRQAWQSVGLLIGELFIDFVDVEWCLRARYLGWTVLGVWDAHMEHHLGHALQKKWGRSYHVHSPWRQYFQTRNAIYLMRQPWLPFGRRLATGYRLLLKCGFYSLVMDNRLDYVRSILRGLKDGFRLPNNLSHVAPSR